MTGKEVSAIDTGSRRGDAAVGFWRASPSRPQIPVPGSRIEDDAAMPEDDDPWLDDEDLDDDGPAAQPKRPFWNR